MVRYSISIRSYTSKNKMTTQIEPSPELLELCKYWIPFLLQKHVRYGTWKDKELSIGDSITCMVGEANGWSLGSYANCPECNNAAQALDAYSSTNRSKNITPVQVNKMIRKGNVFAKHYMKRHSK